MNNPDAEGEDAVHFRVGTALDMMITDPDSLEQTFHISTCERPGGLMAKFIDALQQGLTQNHDKSYYQAAYEASGYGMSINNVISNFWKKDAHVAYYKEREKAKSKKVLTAEEYETALICKKELLTNPCTSEYFARGRKVLFQVPIYWTFDGIECKGMLDMLVINDAEQTIEIIDIKTIRKSANEFPYSFFQYGYYIQAYFYWYAVRELLAGRAVSPALSSSLLERVKDYTVKAPLFMVVPKVEGNRALLYSLSDADMQVLFEGTEKFEGVNSLLSRWSFHNKSQQWEFPREVYLNSGKIPLKIL